ncbi:unnamed protein product [Closterium sp. Naga37s-1]|nr:unnamed protein product [Closterium sp. Naga37s-1]
MECGATIFVAIAGKTPLPPSFQSSALMPPPFLPPVVPLSPATLPVSPPVPHSLAPFRHPSPSPFVTSSFLPNSPLPSLPSLSPSPPPCLPSPPSSSPFSPRRRPPPSFTRSLWQQCSPRHQGARTHPHPQGTPHPPCGASVHLGAAAGVAGAAGAGGVAVPPWPLCRLLCSARLQAEWRGRVPFRQDDVRPLGHGRPLGDGRLFRSVWPLRLPFLLLLLLLAARGLAVEHRELRVLVASQCSSLTPTHPSAFQPAPSSVPDYCADILAAGVALTPTTDTDATSEANPPTSSGVSSTSPDSTTNNSNSRSRAGEWGHHLRYERRAGQCWSRAELPCYAGSRRTQAGLLFPQKQQQPQQQGEGNNTDNYFSATAGQQLQVNLRQYHTYHRECLHREPLDHLRSTLLAGKPTACRYLVFFHSSDAQGNRLLSLVSAFAYALLTNRIFLLSSKGGPAAVLCEPFEHEESWVLFGREGHLEDHYAQVLGLKVAREWRAVREGREKRGEMGGGRRRLVERWVLVQRE